ncbi:hypothetical protein C2857_003901 [Epichloe festucae Fl1]|uniref:Pre-mRNA-splicing factor 38B n=1 Tax=Epichloe festucae (strain Fl1) TaxID=877507 RepID=A0A7U3Q2C3_EPIFF|nr:hypothetical protein C2857_003901 [Epichloe festucae Fl1]
MSNDELLTDDYVAGLLAQDAKDCSLKYSAMGMEAFRDNKKSSSMLKPNTRFLRHIIKDTDTHNKALLAKEAAESKARLKDLEYAEGLKRRKSNPNSRDIRTRQLGAIQAILGGKKRPRGDDEDRDTPRPRTADDGKDGHGSRGSRRGSDLFKRGGDKRHHGRLSERDYDQKDTASDQDKQKKSRRRRYAASDDDDDDDDDDDGDKDRRRRSRRDRSRSPRWYRSSRSPDERRRKHRHRSRGQFRTRRASPDREPKPTSSREKEDSDPLEDFIGPPPPPNYRGRGMIGGAAALDRRFSESYDPKLDVRMEDEGDPWDDAVESFRDRQKMLLNQDQRMKDAGFTVEQIQRAKGSDEKKELDVVWSKAGEKREWDEGKGIAGESDDDDDGDGEISLAKQPTLFPAEL